MAAKKKSPITFTGIGLNIRYEWHGNLLNLRSRPLTDIAGNPVPDNKPDILKKCNGDPLIPTEFIVDGRIGPPLSIIRENLKSYYELYSNVIFRMWDLAITLKTISDSYHSFPNIYRDRLLAFIGNEVVREWPWKDFQFTSVKAQEILNEVTEHTITALYNFEITDNNIKEKIKLLHYEHWTPISFFRDIIEMNHNLSIQDYFEILVCNYRIVRVTKEENTKLTNRHFGQCRPIDAYAQAEIEIYEDQLWTATF